MPKHTLLGIVATTVLLVGCAQTAEDDRAAACRRARLLAVAASPWFGDDATLSAETKLRLAALVEAVDEACRNNASVEDVEAAIARLVAELGRIEVNKNAR